MIVRIAYFMKDGKRKYIKDFKKENIKGYAPTPEEAAVIKSKNDFILLARTVAKKEKTTLREMFYDKQEPKGDAEKKSDESKTVIVQTEDGYILAMFDEQSINKKLSELEDQVTNCTDEKELQALKKQANILIAARKKLSEKKGSKK